MGLNVGVRAPVGEAEPEEESISESPSGSARRVRNQVLFRRATKDGR